MPLRRKGELEKEGETRLKRKRNSLSLGGKRKKKRGQTEKREKVCNGGRRWNGRGSHEAKKRPSLAKKKLQGKRKTYLNRRRIERWKGRKGTRGKNSIKGKKKNARGPKGSHRGKKTETMEGSVSICGKIIDAEGKGDLTLKNLRPEKPNTKKTASD